MTASIPTMPCPECHGDGTIYEHHLPGIPEAIDCERCAGTGRVERQPLVRDEVLRLPVGARVIVQERRHEAPVARVVRMRRGLLMALVRGYLRTLGSMHRVWLAEDADD